MKLVTFSYFWLFFVVLVFVCDGRSFLGVEQSWRHVKHKLVPVLRTSLWTFHVAGLLQ
jgi:hypothetical protein